MSEPTARDLLAKVADIHRNVERARRTMRVQAFVIGVLVVLLISAWAK